VNTLPQPQPIQDHAHSRIKDAARLRADIARHMQPFWSPHAINENVFSGDSNVAFCPIEDGDYFQLKYAGLTIRMVIVVGLDDVQAVAKVQCFHMYNRTGEPKSTLLGEFTINAQGLTNLTQLGGRMLYTQTSADLIAAHFFAKAFENNVKV